MIYTKEEALKLENILVIFASKDVDKIQKALFDLTDLTKTLSARIMDANDDISLNAANLTGGIRLILDAKTGTPICDIFDKILKESEEIEEDDDEYWDEDDEDDDDGF